MEDSQILMTVIVGIGTLGGTALTIIALFSKFFRTKNESAQEAMAIRSDLAAIKHAVESVDDRLNHFDQLIEQRMSSLNAKFERAVLQHTTEQQRIWEAVEKIDHRIRGNGQPGLTERVNQHDAQLAALWRKADNA